MDTKTFVSEEIKKYLRVNPLLSAIGRVSRGGRYLRRGARHVVRGARSARKIRGRHIGRLLRSTGRRKSARRRSIGKSIRRTIKGIRRGIKKSRKGLSIAGGVAGVRARTGAYRKRIRRKYIPKIRYRKRRK